MRASIGTALLFAGPILCIAAPAYSRTWLVYEDGSGDAPTIQAAIDSASAEDSVLVGPGTYPGLLSYRGKDVVLKSLQGPEATILDGQQQGSVITFAGGETRAAVLEGFTIRNGSGTDVHGYAHGGAVYLPEASPTIRGNLVRENSAYFAGGIFVGTGIPSSGAPLPELLVTENTFEENIADGSGGAMQILSSYAEVTHNTFIANRATRGDGGGVYVDLRTGTTLLHDNVFLNNWAGDKGGGIHVYTSINGGGGPVEIHGNLLVGNVAMGTDIGDSGGGGGIYANSMVGFIRWNTLVGNRGFGETACSGGGMALEWGSTGVEIVGNIIVGSEGCGIACRHQETFSMGSNLFWDNDTDVGCPGSWNEFVIVADPLFCAAATAAYRVAANSPALTGPEPMGAFHEPGCSAVAVRRTTWGLIKARHE